MNTIEQPTEEELKQGWQEFDAANLPTEVLKSALQTRGFNVIDNTEYDEATGLLKWKGDMVFYFEPDTRKLVPTEEAYKRASGGW